jgi:transposase InsO family protein
VLAAAGVTHKRTRPYRPQSNGKVERRNLTLEREWAYARPYRSNQRRLDALPAWLHDDNHHRPHRALDGRSPMQLLNNLPSTHT